MSSPDASELEQLGFGIVAFACTTCNGMSGALDPDIQKEIVERHRIIAPFDGMVAEKMAEVGEWVQTGNPVLRFVDTENLRLGHF